VVATVVQLKPEVRYEWAVFQRRPLTSLPRWKQWLARRVYKLLDWQTADGEEKQAICTSEAVAKAICAAGGPNWFYHRLPVNVSLPAETCKLDGVRFPYSEAAQFYEGNGKKKLEVLCPITGEVCRQHETIKRDDLIRVAQEVDKLSAKLSA